MTEVVAANEEHVIPSMYLSAPAAGRNMRHFHAPLPRRIAATVVSATTAIDHARRFRAAAALAVITISSPQW
jgi:hypothetical protein